MSGIWLKFSPVNLDSIVYVDILFTSGSTFDLAHRQQIFMDSTKQRPLTSGLWLFERGPGRDGRVEDVEAKVSVPQISPLGEGWQWLVSARSLASSSSSSSWNRSLLLLLWARFCIASSPEMLPEASVASFNPTLGSGNSLSISHARYVPCWEVTNEALVDSVKQLERQFHEMLRKSTQFPQPTLQREISTSPTKNLFGFLKMFLLSEMIPYKMESLGVLSSCTPRDW